MNALRAELLKLVTLPATQAGLVLLVVWRAEPAFILLGVLAAAQEYEGGRQIRASLLAVPHRSRLVLTQTAALAIVTAPVALLAGENPATALVAGAVTSLIRHPIPALALLLTAYLFFDPPHVVAVAPIIAAIGAHRRVT